MKPYSLFAAAICASALLPAQAPTPPAAGSPAPARPWRGLAALGRCLDSLDNPRLAP